MIDMRETAILLVEEDADTARLVRHRPGVAGYVARLCSCNKRS